MNFLRTRWAQLAALTALLGGIGIYSLREKYGVTDFDTWWHLKVGDWIIRNSALPHTGILSRTAADRAWVAYSWGYEVLLSLAYSGFGLVGIGALGTILTVGVAFSIYWMLRRISGGFWLPCVLTGITCAAFLFSGAPRPVFFSYIFYCVTLALLLETQRTERVQSLYWLPFVFMLWANLHIQFVYGLVCGGVVCCRSSLAADSCEAWICSRLPNALLASRKTAGGDLCLLRFGYFPWTEFLSSLSGRAGL